MEQGDSSEEEGLKKTMFCSGCGSYRCQRVAVHCREADKVSRLSHLLETLNPVVSDGYAKIPVVSEQFLASLNRQVAEMAERAANREAEKCKTRRNREERRFGHVEEITSGRYWGRLAECIQKERKDPGSFLLHQTKDQSLVDYAYAQMMQASTNVGRALYNQLKLQEDALAGGRRYRRDSAAAAVGQVVAHTQLKKAVVQVCAKSDAVRAGEDICWELPSSMPKQGACNGSGAWTGCPKSVLGSRRRRASADPSRSCVQRPGGGASRLERWS